MDFGSYLPPVITNFEGVEETSGVLMSKSEFYNFRATSRGLTKQPGDDYFAHQRIVRQYMVYNDRLMVIHDAGTGKTRTTLGFLNELVTGPLKGVYKRVVIATPSDLLHDNWKNNPEIERFKSKLAIEYVTHYKLSTLDPGRYPRTFFIVDEAHVAANENVSFDKNDSKINSDNSTTLNNIYSGIWNILHKAEARKIMLLTATPMQNSVNDFYPLVNLILSSEDQINPKNPPGDDAMLKILSGRVSYVRSAEEGIDIQYGLSPKMMEAINVGRLINNIGKVKLGYIFDIQLNTPYFIPGISINTPHSHLMMELVRNGEGGIPVEGTTDVTQNSQGVLEGSVVIDLNTNQVVWRNTNNPTLEFALDRDPEGVVRITFQGIGLEDIDQLDFVFSVPSTLNNKVYPTKDHTADVVESMLSPVHSLHMVDKFDQIRNPLEDQGVSIIDNELSSIGVTTPSYIYQISNLFTTIILTFLYSLSPELRSQLTNENWKRYIGNTTVEVGKNIFFESLVDEDRGGIKKLASLLESIGYREFKYEKQNGSNAPAYGQAPRYILNPSPDEIEVFNHPENWDGKYIQISLYSPAGATGVSYFDVRHIHLIPTYSPAQNTQALFRGIRAKSHENIRSRLSGEDFEVRVYKHVSTPMLSVAPVNIEWLREASGIMVPERFEGSDDDWNVLNPPLDTLTIFSKAAEYDQAVNNYTRVLGKDSNDDYIFDKFQFTINGFAMQYIPNPTVHPKTSIPISNLRLPKREGFSNTINETFYSPLAYRLIVATVKDVGISKMRMLYKQAAMDCDLNKIRNTLPEQFDNTELCDYDTCDYQCLPALKGLVIDMDDIDPVTGEDLRWSRDPQNPSAPLSSARLSTGDVYGHLTDYDRKQLIRYTFEKIESNPLGYAQIYTLVIGMKEKFGSKVSENQYISILADMIYSNRYDERIRDRFGASCTLKTQGSIVYICPLYESERKIYFSREGEVASRFLHGSTKRLITNQSSWDQISSDTNTLRTEYADFIEKNSSNTIDKLFELAGENFDRFVRIIEGAYLAGGNVIQKRFSKFFMNTTLDTIDKIEDKGKYFLPTISAWKTARPTSEINCYFHFLYHMHPAFKTVKKPISENAPIKIYIPDLYDGFVGATDLEQRILYEIAEEADKKKINDLVVESRARDSGVIAILDDKKFIEKEARDKLEYFKIYVPPTEPDKKHPQGQVCSTIPEDKLRTIAGNLGVGIPEFANKEKICRTLYDRFVELDLIH